MYCKIKTLLWQRAPFSAIRKAELPSKHTEESSGNTGTGQMLREGAQSLHSPEGTLSAVSGRSANTDSHLSAATQRWLSVLPGTNPPEYLISLG